MYLTENGERLAAIVPAEAAAEIESLRPEAYRELIEDFADAQVARESLAEVEDNWACLRIGRSWSSRRKTARAAEARRASSNM